MCFKQNSLHKSKKDEIVYDWIISNINILQDNLPIILKSKEFQSNLSKWILQANIERQHLAICLVENSVSHTFWASDSSLSLPDLIPPIKKLGNDQGIGGCTKLCIQIPIHTIPTKGPLKVTFAVTITSSEYQHSDVTKPAADNQRRLHRIESIFKNEHFWDTEIIVGENRFKVHKAVLASASEVFQKMFQSEMQEKTTGIVKVSDADSAIMQDLLTFAYTGTAPNLKTHAKQLMITADKYCMQDLTDTCSKYLNSNLSIDNAAEILLLSNSIPTAHVLKSKCINFVRKYISSVSETDTWEVLVSSSKELAVECMNNCPVQFSASDFEKKEISYLWIINEAKTLHQTRAVIKGPQINSDIFPYPLYICIDFTNSYVSAILTSDSIKDITLSNRTHLDVWAVDCSFSIINIPTQQPFCTIKIENKQLINIRSTTSQGIFAPTTYFYSINSLTAKILDDDKNIDNFLHDGSLCIQVVVNIVNTKEYIQSNSHDICLTPTNHHTLFESGVFSDVTIQVQKTKFNAHKVILAAASEVFHQQLQKSQSKNILADDISPDVMSDLLMYIYAGNCPNTHSNTNKILIAADRYRLPGLVSQCLYELQVRFTSSNVAETLSMCDQLYYADIVKLACIEFIKKNSVSVFKSDSWKSLKESSVSVAFEVLQATLIHQNRS